VVRPDRIGDVVLITPLVRALRKQFPNGSIGVLVRPYAADVLRNNPHVDTILLDDPQGQHAGPAGLLQQVRRIRQQRFDTALMPLPSSRHAWLCFLAGIRQRLATSRKLYNRLTLTRCIRRNTQTTRKHEADYCLDLARAIGVPDDGLHTEMFLTDDEVALAHESLGAGNLVGIHASSGGSAPNWPVAHYVALAEHILDMADDIRIVLTGGAEDAALGAAFARLPATRVINLIGQPSLRRTAAIIARLRVFVSASTGPMHMAGALRVPTVSMFCPLPACAPALWGPLGNEAAIVLPPDGYCQHQCPGDPHICQFTDGIAVATVAARVRQVLETHAHQASL
jgi:heptosyltransferase-2